MISLPVTVLFVWKDGFLWFRIAEFKQAGRLLWIQKKGIAQNGLSLKERRKASFNAVIKRGSYLLILIKVEDARGIRCTRKKGSL